MKLALITDIHANREALEAVLEHAQQQGMEQAAFLGDFVGYGADPGWVLDTVMAHVERGAKAVAGNHDEGAVQGPSQHMHEQARQAIEWTRRTLSADHHRFLATLPMTASMGDILLVHANAHAPGGWGYIQSRGDAVRSLHATRSRYTFCGHMHEPMLYHLSALGKAGDFRPTAGVSIPVLPHRQWLAIPGSVGQPRDGNPAACYALFDTDQQVLTFHRVPYDHEAAASKIRAAGLPERFAERLKHGQ